MNICHEFNLYGSSTTYMNSEDVSMAKLSLKIYFFINAYKQAHEDTNQRELHINYA